MKSVLISIQPKWVEKIVKGEKTIEVRKSRPKIETPFKCYIYCTKDKYEWLYRVDNNGYGKPQSWHGKVIGEFVCNKIYTYYADDFVGAEDFDGTIITEPKEGEFAYWIPNQEDTCLRYLGIKAYGKGKTLYGWHISNLKIYDKPKELSDFYKPCPTEQKGNCYGCYYLADRDYGGICVNNLTRPPQSWQYVEVDV